MSAPHLGLALFRVESGRSDWPELRRIEQHGSAVGHDVTAAETVVVEAVNRKPLTQPAVRVDWGLPEEIARG